MKDIKSMIIGFLLAVCIFLFMGMTKSKDQTIEEIYNLTKKISIDVSEIKNNQQKLGKSLNMHNAPPFVAWKSIENAQRSPL